jgi:hypothetical protein
VTYENFTIRENIPSWITPKIEKLKTSNNLVICNAINPFYLEGDFNGDNNLDIAFFVYEKESKKKGILIIHGKSFQTYVLGAGNEFGNGGKNFSWMQVWKLYREKNVSETIFNDDDEITGSKVITINNIAIEVAPSEGASNIIVWSKDKYTWIHTGD